MGYQKQTAGGLDRVFNSTISLPQQILWRVWRVIEDDNIDLFEEKGLWDGALVPFLGMFDDHAEDVMPDYMAAQLGRLGGGSGEEKDTGFWGQLGAAIVSDPLTYFTGGMTSAAKLGKAVQLAKSSTTVNKVVKAAAAAKKMDVDTYLHQLKPAGLRQHLDEAADLLEGQGGWGAEQMKLVDAARHGLDQAIPAAEEAAHLAGTFDKLTIASAIKSRGDRQIAIGLPGLHTYGAKYDIAPGYSSWWQLYKDGINKGGTLLTKAALLSGIVDIPGVSTGLRHAYAPIKNWRGGYKIGYEAQIALSAGGAVNEADVKLLRMYLSEGEGASELVKKLHDAAEADGTSELLTRILDRYTDNIHNKGLHHGEAFQKALSSNGISKSGETPEQIYGRLAGLGKDNKDFPDWGAGAAQGREEIAKLLDDAVANHAKASRLKERGIDAITPVDTEARDVANFFQTSRESLTPTMQKFARWSFETGRAYRGYLNQIFKTGEKTKYGEKAYSDFLSHVARDNDHVEELSRSLFEKLYAIAEGNHGFTASDLTKLVGKVVELSSLPGEISAAVRAFDVNTSNPQAILRSLDNFMVRQRRSMTTLKKLLPKLGINNPETRQALVDVLGEQVFPFLEVEGKQSLIGKFKRLIVGVKEHVAVYTPDQLSQLQRPTNGWRVLGQERIDIFEGAGFGQGQRDVLGEYVGRQAGTLTEPELADALTQLQRQGQRARTGPEILSAASEIIAVRQFAENNGISVGEAVGLLRHRPGAVAHRVKQSVLEPPPLWDEARTRWRAADVEKNLSPYGLHIVSDLKTGLYRLVSSRVTDSTLRRNYKYNPTKLHRTYREVMQSARSVLADSSYSRNYGPGAVASTRTVKVPAGKVAQLRELLTTDQIKMLTGKGTVFDDAELPPGLLPDWMNLSKLAERRALPARSHLREAPIEGQKTKAVYAEDSGLPRGNSDLELFFRKGGIDLPEEGMSDWAVNYARGRLLIREVRNAVVEAQKRGGPIEIDPTILADIEAHVLASGRIVRDLMETALPKEFNDMLNVATELSSYSFQGAKRSGVWIPGSPIAYLARFTTKEARQRIKHLMQDIEKEDGAILTRLGVSQAQYFKRSYDDLTVEDLNDLLAELSEIMNTKGVSPKLAEFHTRLDREVKALGVEISGLPDRIPITGARIENDPFVALLQRLGVAQQDKNLEEYFDTLLDLSKGDNGESAMMGGKVVGIINDTGKVQKASGTSFKAKSISRKGGEEVVELAAHDAPRETIPISFIIEMPDGTTKIIENGIFNESSFGMLKLGTAVPEGMEATTFVPSLGKAFARSSMRSDFINNMHQQPLTAEQATELLGQQVVLGNQSNITAAIKSAAQVHKVTHSALRTFDAINYGIKSFQTIYRLPFSIANASSGVFQAHMAGATPKNIALGYIDALRLLFGNQDFAKHSSKVSDMLDAGQTMHSNGIINLFKGNRPRVLEEARLYGGGDFARHLDRGGNLDDLDRVERLVLDLPGGGQQDVLDFVHMMGEDQLFGTYASSLTRGSRASSDSLVRIKFQALDPARDNRLLGLPKAILKRMANMAEDVEIVNRMALSLALLRDGHAPRRAIQIAKEAHVPYEKLTPFEKNKIKRLSVYYTFPRHYMPWAWSKFAEDPSKLARIGHYIRDQKLITIEEGKPNIVIGDYRMDLGRLNANFEAAGLMYAFADRVMMPAVEGIVPGVDGYDARKLGQLYSDSGLTSVGGIAGLFLGSNVLDDPQRSNAPQRSMWEEATRIVWPFKAAAWLTGKIPSKEEESPFVQYTPLESWFTDNVYGIGTRKVRDNHEVRRTEMAYRRIVKRLQLRARATSDIAKRERLQSHIHEMAQGLAQVRAAATQKIFK